MTHLILPLPRLADTARSRRNCIFGHNFRLVQDASVLDQYPFRFRVVSAKEFYYACDGVVSVRSLIMEVEYSLMLLVFLEKNMIRLALWRVFGGFEAAFPVKLVKDPVSSGKRTGD